MDISSQVVNRIENAYTEGRMKREKKISINEEHLFWGMRELHCTRVVYTNTNQDTLVYNTPGIEQNAMAIHRNGS